MKFIGLNHVLYVNTKTEAVCLVSTISKLIKSIITSPHLIHDWVSFVLYYSVHYYYYYTTIKPNRETMNLRN